MDLQKDLTTVQDKELYSLFKQFTESLRTIGTLEIDALSFTELYTKLNGIISSIYMTLNSYYDERMYNYFEKINNIQKRIFQHMRKIRIKQSYQTMKNMLNNPINKDSALDYTVSIVNIPDFDIFNLIHGFYNRDELQSVKNELLLKTHEFNMEIPYYRSAVCTLTEFIIDNEHFKEKKTYSIIKDYYDDWNKIKHLFEKGVLTISENNTFIEDSHQYSEDCLITYQTKYQNILDEDIDPINLKADKRELRNTSIYICKMLGQEVITTYNIATNQILFIISAFKNIEKYLEDLSKCL